jgi:hypothetical protein
VSQEIAYCKIFPALGIARVGNSQEHDGFFVGPEGIPGSLAPNEHHFKDKSGAVLRQAARFRVYAFDSKDRVLGEITTRQAKITWKVSLANKKSGWYAFNGAANALAQFDDSEPAKWPLRNRHLTGPERARRLHIDPGKPVLIMGKNACRTDAEPNKYAFVGKFQDLVEVYLGELRTDESGRLLVLGGRGHSAAIDVDGKDVSGVHWITNYANNDLWHDDTSDGPVECTVEIDGHSVSVRGRAWVLVTPPDFAPETTNIVTLFDVMEEAALKYRLPHPGLPAPIGTERVEFWRDIYPIFGRLAGYSWVSDLGLRGHAKGKGGDFSGEEILKALSDPNDEGGQLKRNFIFSRIRKPPELQGGKAEAIAQASGYFMPALSGDEGDTVTGDPTTWLTVTTLQYKRLEAWAHDQFVPGTRKPAHHSSPADEPGILTRTVLEACAGGAFFPGIEMTAIARSKKAYSEAFRLSQNLEPGDVTKFMAVPWQADFFECNTHWWPAQRPDSTITAESVDELRTAFSYEQKSGDLQSLMLVRQPWARGIDTERPDPTNIQTWLFSEPKSSESLPKYLDRLCVALSDADSGVFSVLPGKVLPVKELLPERLPSLGRIQYLLQEQFDLFGGRYFHFVVPSPYDFEHSLRETETSHKRRKSNRSRGDRATVHDEHIDIDEAHSQSKNDEYIAFIQKEFSGYCRHILEAFATSGETAIDYYRRLSELSSSVGGFIGGVGAYESSVREDFTSRGAHFHNLSIIEMAQCAIDLVYITWSNQAGDNGMVKRWYHLGFVTRKTLTAKNGADSDSAEAYVETERYRLRGMQYRDYYYMLSNIEDFPEMYDYSVVIADDFLSQAREAIDKQQFGDPDTIIIETFFEYDANTFSAKLEEIYEHFREQAVAEKPWEEDETKAEIIVGRVHIAPFNQNDGAWLRYIANAGPTDEVRGFLFDVWSDEFGNGNPALHHGNLYTTFLRNLNIALPEVTTREYADYKGFSDSDFATPVFELAISQNSDRYFPEILGMTLFLEWEVLSLASGIKRYDYHGLNSQFWRMHVGIDNAVDGHGAKARDGVILYLDNVLKQSGREAMQREWKRIWTGFVAFATAGMGYLGSDDQIAARRPATIYDQMKAMIGRKQHYGSLNHMNKKIGVNRINDWFDDPDGFLDELAHSAWVVPGNPVASRILSYLTTFDGPMYEVFDANDLALWRDWILWLGRNGTTAAVKTYQTKSESMLRLLEELRSSTVGTEGHTRYKLKGKSLHEWFSGNLIEFMRALGAADSPWVTPWDAGRSPLVRDFAAGTNAMAQALDRRFSALGNQVGRLVVVRWINAGCPIPGEPIPTPKTRSEPIAPQVRRTTLVEMYGMGAVH